MNFPKYPHIENLKSMTDILQYNCVITEKIHGTNFRVMFNDEHGLVLGSHTNTIYQDGQELGSLYGATQWCLENGVEQKIKKYKDYVFYGEFHGSGIQKGIVYCDGSKKDLRIYDIRNPEGNFLDWDQVVSICKEIDLKLVEVVKIGMIDVEWLKSIIDNDSITSECCFLDSGMNTWEGVAIKPVKAMLDKHGNYFIAKYKSVKWAENAKQAKPKDVDPSRVELNSAAKAFAEQVVTMGRFSTILDHITRDGNQELSMKRTGEFLREFVNDIMEEHKELYDQLDKQQKNVYNKAINTLAIAMWESEVNVVI